MCPSSKITARPHPFAERPRDAHARVVAPARDRRRGGDAGASGPGRPALALAIVAARRAPRPRSRLLPSGLRRDGGLSGLQGLRDSVPRARGRPRFPRPVPGALPPPLRAPHRRLLHGAARANASTHGRVAAPRERADGQRGRSLADHARHRHRGCASSRSRARDPAPREPRYPDIAARRARAPSEGRPGRRGPAGRLHDFLRTGRARGLLFAAPNPGLRAARAPVLRERQGAAHQGLLARLRAGRHAQRRAIASRRGARLSARRHRAGRCAHVPRRVPQTTRKRSGLSSVAPPGVARGAEARGEGRARCAGLPAAVALHGAGARDPSAGDVGEGFRVARRPPRDREERMLWHVRRVRPRGRAQARLARDLRALVDVARSTQSATRVARWSPVIPAAPRWSERWASPRGIRRKPFYR